ncbi:hypothetical protein RN001_000055 [Aquatica leii]|uniref:Spliceosome-associated protein CWC27 homolog n=1 Tax=Aquatica leii TaxID=1421715 RepID=A0AAN7SKA1_9COLE|nr:hypothetical protein RN001_000055 [Aquatica leii]
MSNVYILEPPTSAKVLLKTTVGDIDIELWAKETPKTSRNFIQLCLEGYYDDTIFHRVVKGFIAQGGDPEGTGAGGESIYGEPFKDEFHQRLKFVRRGLVAMANSSKDDNGSQFFFTLAAAPELQNKHTIFGKVTGETLFNMLKLEDGLIEDERPVFPHKIIKADVLSNPFTDIVPRKKEIKEPEKKKKVKTPGVKNFKLLSFGEEAEEDEEETKEVIKKFAGKSKSTHDVLNDPKLSSETTDKPPEGPMEENAEQEPDLEEQLQSIRKKLKAESNKTYIKKSFFEDEDEMKKRKQEEIKKEIENVKREYHKNKLQRDKKDAEEQQEHMHRSETLKEYQSDNAKYKEIKNSFPKKGSSREEFTLNLLSKFKEKLQAVKEKEREEEEAKAKADLEANQLQDAEKEDESWMTHELHFVDNEPILAKDANTKADDWFEIYDPRNPLNKRRRGEQTSTSNR